MKKLTCNPLGVDQRLLDASFGVVFGNGIEFLNSSVFEELKNTGNIQLLSNVSLNYYHFVDKQILNVRN